MDTEEKAEIKKLTDAIRGQVYTMKLERENCVYCDAGYRIQRATFIFSALTAGSCFAELEFKAFGWLDILCRCAFPSRVRSCV